VRETRPVIASAACTALDTLPGTGRAQQAALNNIVPGARVGCRCAALSVLRRAPKNATPLCTLHNAKKLCSPQRDACHDDVIGAQRAESGSRRACSPNDERCCRNARLRAGGRAFRQQSAGRGGRGAFIDRPDVAHGLQM